ncbi:MAG TPA: GspH/FimT family pseudopilin [Vicinamibacterales bacterium]|nr:GspH/FimT family pseudopilin [Vicinamibacterales bacterium]
MSGVFPRTPRPQPRGARGYTLVEALFAAGVLVTLAAVALPQMAAGLEDARVRSAARYLAARLREARMLAVHRSARVGVRFEPAGDDYAVGTFLDGNGNGVRSAEIQRGIDPPLRSPERLGDAIAGVRFGLLPGVPPVEGGTGTDPIRIASGSILSFSPDGSSSGGTVYLCGGGRAQYAVRVFGVTGRTRVLRFEQGSRTWTAF